MFSSVLDALAEADKERAELESSEMKT